MNLKIALIGNPNSGKTTLFNALTGARQKTGNWTGVTTEEKTGKYKKDKRITLIDLPGLYSLSTNSVDERTVLKYLKQTPPDLIINVVDGTNLERNLFLTTELANLKIPIVIAVNMLDELKKNKMTLNLSRLEDLFKVKALPVSALKGENLDRLIKIAKEHEKPPQTRIFGSVTAIYEFIESEIDNIITKRITKSQKITEKIDGVLMHKILGMPVFFLVMFVVYFLSMRIGGALGSVITVNVERFNVALSIYLHKNRVADFIIGLFCDGFIKGFGVVFSFLPQILILFALMAVIEESGYASRISFVLDRFFRAFGLGGKSVLPLIVSCGCTVSGLMATRTIDGDCERRMTVFLSPFMPCGAKTAVFAWLSTILFNGNVLVATSTYFLGIFAVAIFGNVLKKLRPFKSRRNTFILEIPTLRVPSIKDVMFVLIEKTKDFITKAWLTVMLVSVALWALGNIGLNGYVNGKIEQSFLFLIGNALKYLFYPLGFCNWQTSVSLVSGIFAKEAIAETLQLTGADVNTLFNNGFSAYAFMTFVLLSPPCMASIITAKEELGSYKWLIFMLVFQLLSAYLVAFLINLLGNLIEYSPHLLFSLIVGIITMIIGYTVKSSFNKCSGCNRADCKKLKENNNAI